MMSIYIVCPKCEGEGKIRKYLILRTRCSECRGNGKIQLDLAIDQYIPNPQNQLESVNQMKEKQENE